MADMAKVIESARAFAIHAAGEGRLSGTALPESLAAFDAASAGGQPTHEQAAAVLAALNTAIAELGADTYLRVTRPLAYWANIVVRRVSLIVVAVLLVMAATYASTVISVAGRITEAVKAIKVTDPYAYVLEATTRKPEPDPAAWAKVVSELRDADSSYKLINVEHDRMQNLAQPVRDLVSGLRRPRMESEMKVADARLGPERRKETVPDKDHQRVLALMEMHNISPSLVYADTIKMRGNEAAANLDLFGRWLLPVICGLMGGLVYIMRLLLDPARNVDLRDVAIRILAGGMAGLVVGWFMAPSALSLRDLPEVTATPYGLAFFAGFSIDVLFGLLDRIKRALIDTPATPAR